MHVIPFFGDLDNSDLFYNIFFKQYFDTLVCRFHGCSFTDANQQMILW